MAAAYYPRARVLLEVLLEDFGDGSSSDLHSLDIVPLSAEVDRNDHREADSARIELAYRDLPLDPRAARAMTAYVFMGDVGAPDLDVPMDDANYRVFVGQVDLPETTLEDGGETVSLECRDFTSLFLDHKWRGSIDIDRDLVSIIEDIVASVPGASGLQRQYEYHSWATTPSAVLGRTLWVPGKGEDAWTVLTSLLGALGMLPVVELDVLRITTLENLGQRRAALLYGDNISRLVFRRNFQETSTSRVVATTWDEQAREARTASYPSDPAIRKRLGLDGIATVSEPQVLLQLMGSYTETQLEDIARETWLEMARGQVEGELETKELRDGDDQVDLWQLAAGDTLLVTLGKGDPSFFASMSESEAVAWLTAGSRGLDQGAAQALVASWRQAEELGSLFYVVRASHRWRLEEGYSLTVEFATLIGGE